jgi:hypothetical protein
MRLLLVAKDMTRPRYDLAHNVDLGEELWKLLLLEAEYLPFAPAVSFRGVWTATTLCPGSSCI